MKPSGVRSYVKVFKSYRMSLIVTHTLSDKSDLLSDVISMKYNNTSVDFASFNNWKNVRSYVLSLKYLNHNWVFSNVN